MQLRAWGEPEAAALLRRVDDDAILALQKRQQKLAGGPLVDSAEAAALALDAAAGERQRPRREAPSPRLFQYPELMAPFAR